MSIMSLPFRAPLCKTASQKLYFVAFNIQRNRHRVTANSTHCHAADCACIEVRGHSFPLWDTQHSTTNTEHWHLCILSNILYSLKKSKLYIFAVILKPSNATDLQIIWLRFTRPSCILMKIHAFISRNHIWNNSRINHFLSQVMSYTCLRPLGAECINLRTTSLMIQCDLVLTDSLLHTKLLCNNSVFAGGL